MRQVLLGVSIGLILLGGTAHAQPKPKSNEEVKAINAMFQAKTPDEQIAAANTLLEKFADTEFKSIAYQLLAADYQRKGDFPKAVVYGERSLEADPKNFEADLVLGREYVQNTHDTDFDKDAKLGKATKYANDALSSISTAAKPNPNTPDADWEAGKKDVQANAHEILGLVALARKDPKTAAQEFQTSAETAAHPEPATYVRLALADNMQGKYDDAIAAADKASNMPEASAAVKSAAADQKQKATQAKNKPAAGPKP